MTSTLPPPPPLPFKMRTMMMNDDGDPIVPPPLPPPPPNSGFSISVVQECTAIKKGLLWEQQQNRLFLFNRWKERFFILTPDYLTCFKKGSKKVGMSEMGSFVYKINLNDIKNLSWVDKKKNGVIGVQLANTVIFLWNGADTVLDDWMAVLQDSTVRTKDRRSENQSQINNKSTSIIPSGKVRKSATLLPTVSLALANGGMESSALTKPRSPKLMSHETGNNKSSTIINGDKNNDDWEIVPIPPPPPPRRYLRCLSTDLSNNNKMEETSQIQTMTPPPLSRNFHQKTSSPIILRPSSKTLMMAHHNKMSTKPEPEIFRKFSNASTASSSTMSQSLRCKSSYSIQQQHSPLILSGNESPRQLNQNHQRRITAKRLSSLQPPESNNNRQHQPPQPSRQSFGKYFQSADSEFTFVNSRAATFQKSSGGHQMIMNDLNRDGGGGPRISSSASLMLNHHHQSHARRKDFSTRLDPATRRFLVGTTGPPEMSTLRMSATPPPPPPPPVPPHRTHVHHF